MQALRGMPTFKEAITTAHNAKSASQLDRGMPKDGVPGTCTGGRDG